MKCRVARLCELDAGLRDELWFEVNAHTYFKSRSDWFTGIAKTVNCGDYHSCNRSYCEQSNGTLQGCSLPGRSRDSEMGGKQQHDASKSVFVQALSLIHI